MPVADAKLRNVVRASHPGPLSIPDAETILEIAQLAVDADGREDPDEIATFFALGKHVFALAGVAELPTPTFAPDEDDREHLTAVAQRLTGPAARELAYTAAYVLTILDVAVAPEEDAFIEDLRVALGLTEARARELAAAIGNTIAPLA